VRVSGYASGVALLLMTSLIYASTFVIIKDATDSIHPLTFVLLRFATATLALLPLARKTLRGATRALWQRCITAGVLFGAGFLFQTAALARIDAGRTGFITGLYVVATPLLALVLFRYPLTRRAACSIVLAVLGMLLLSYSPGSDLAGDGFALAAALVFAGHVIAVERFPLYTDWRFAALVQCASVVATSSALAVATGTPLMATNDEAWLAILFAGVAATALTLPIQVVAQRHVPAGQTALLFALEAPFAALFGTVIRSEPLTALGLAGCALMFLATVLTSFTPRPIERV
jgi:drug/metabolite transporter (DMT)-like permease